MLRNQNGNGEGRTNRQRRNVKRWETLEVLHSGQKGTNKVDICFVIEIKQPIFEDDTKGFPKMTATLRRGDRFIRFKCFDGDISEINALISLFEEFNNIPWVGDFRERYDQHVVEHKMTFGKNRESSRHGGVGGGLSRFTSESKTRRRRRKTHNSGEKIF